MTDMEVANTQEDAANTPSEWFWAEGIKGEGPRPDYLPEKFSSVSDAAKARAELEKKLGAFTGAPETYSVEHLGLDPEQHTLKELIGLSKELNMSQSGFDKLISKLMGAQEAEKTVSLEDEILALGEDGQRQKRQFEHFTKNNLQPEELELVSGWIKSANDMKVFNELVKGVYGKRIPTDNSMYLAGTNDTEESVRNEMSANLDRYKNDKAYREDIRNRLNYIEVKNKRGAGLSS